MSLLLVQHTVTTKIYPLSLHDALPIFDRACRCSCDGNYDARARQAAARSRYRRAGQGREQGDRKSTRLNSSHTVISYAVFCLKKKKKRKNTQTSRERL